MAKEILTVLEVREYLSDYTKNNHLLDGEEFSDTFITLSRDLAVDSWNGVPPFSSNDVSNFPSKGILLYGTLWHMFSGKAALLARNTMSYSDGGLQIPVEERAELYLTLAGQFQGMFAERVRALKTHQNMESGWGHVFSDEITFPLF